MKLQPKKQASNRSDSQLILALRLLLNNLDTSLSFGNHWWNQLNFVFVDIFILLRLKNLIQKLLRFKLGDEEKINS